MKPIFVSENLTQIYSFYTPTFIMFSSISRMTNIDNLDWIMQFHWELLLLLLCGSCMTPVQSMPSDVISWNIQTKLSNNCAISFIQCLNLNKGSLMISMHYWSRFMVLGLYLEPNFIPDVFTIGSFESKWCVTLDNRTVFLNNIIGSS